MCQADIVASSSMSSDATTLPLPGASPTDSAIGRGGWFARGRARELADAESGVLTGALALAAIVALSLFVVLLTANRPSLLSPTSHIGYFPRWMAGPFGGLLSGFTNNSTTLKILFTGSLALMYLAYVLVLGRARRLPARWIVAAIVSVHVIYLLSPPMALTDVFNYINYGRMEVVHNLNPYTTIPVLEPHNDPAFLLSNWHQLLSPYGPLFTLLTFAVVPLGVAGSFWALKGVLALASLATILLVWKCARLLDRDPLVAVTLVGLNPIVLVWGLGGEHNDFLMLLFIVLSFYLLLRASKGVAHRLRAAPSSEDGQDIGVDGWVGERGWGGGFSLARLREWLLPLSPLQMGSGAALVTATALKASGGILIPVVLAGLLRVPRALTQVILGMLLAAVVLGVASLMAFGLHIPDLSTQGSLVTAESIPNLIGLAAGAGGETSGLREALSVVLVLLVFACCWQAWSRRTPDAARAGGVQRAITASGWASVALLATLSWVLPWYVLWVLPLAALSSSRRLRTTALVFGVYLIVVWAPGSSSLWNALHFYPQKTELGRLHQRLVKELLN